MRLRIVGSLAFALCLLSLGCASTRAVRPLGRGHTELSLGVGGPLSDSYRSANPPPIPATTLGVRHGASERVDLFADLYASAWVLGVTWLDVGAAFALLPCESRRVCLLASGTSHVLTNFTDTMLLEQLTLVASVQLGPLTPYLGWDAVVQVMPALDHMPIGFTGLRVEPGRWFVQAEARWYAPFSEGERSTSHYLSPFGAGALGLSLSVGARL